MTDEETQHLVEDGTRELRVAFDVFDTDGDGTLDAPELQRALAALGQPADAGEVAKMIAAADANGDRRLDFREFLTLVEPPPPGLDPEADLRLTFRMLDADGDGYLTAHELSQAGDASMDAVEARSIVAAGDSDGDGRLTYADFRRLMKAG